MQGKNVCEQTIKNAEQLDPSKKSNSAGILDPQQEIKDEQCSYVNMRINLE
jgi:hypothetical protein